MAMLVNFGKPSNDEHCDPIDIGSRYEKYEHPKDQEPVSFMDSLDASTTSLFSRSFSGRRERKKSIFQKSNARDEKIDSILQLNLNLQNLQVELIQMMQHLNNSFHDIRQIMNTDTTNVASRFDKMEDLVKKIEAPEPPRRRNSMDKEEERSSLSRQKTEKNLMKKKKKRCRKAIKASAVQENYIAKKIPKTEDIQHIIFQAIKSNMHFKSCSDEELNDITLSFDSMQSSAGSVIAAQGETLDRLFVIETGTVDIFVDGEHVTSVKLQGTFGDFALLYGCASTSTFRARDDCKLWYILREDFRNITSHYRRKRLELKTNFLKGVKIGERVLVDVLDASEIDALALATGAERFRPGDAIVKEGERGEIFYMIEEGTVDVFKESCGPNPLVTLKNGNFFGEKALLSDDVRQASCIATSDVKCLILVRNDFVRMLGSLQELLDRTWKQPKDDEMNLTSEKDDKQEKTKPEYDFKLSDLDLVNNLGFGTFSSVKLASIKESCKEKYTSLADKQFALKCSSKQMLIENELTHHIQNEKNILSGIDHPFIVGFYSDFEDESYIYFLLEAVIGVELLNVLCEEIQFPENWSRFYAASVVLAFSEIHSKKIAYRDLKPENIMLDSSGYIKIVDFGFAKVVDGGKTWTLCGTPDYFAPEVIRNEGHDWAVDYWGLGVLIFEMMTGSPPFTADSEVEIYTKIVSGEIKFPPTMNPELKHLIQSLCTIDQSKRLGRTKGGFETVKQHLWFSGFSWQSLYDKQLKAPYIAKVVNVDGDVNGFNSKIRMSNEISVKKKALSSRTLRPSSLKNHCDTNNWRPSTARCSQCTETIIYTDDDNKQEPTQESINPKQCLINGVNEKTEQERKQVNEGNLPDQVDKSSTNDRESDGVNKNLKYGENHKAPVAPDVSNRIQSYMFGRNRYEEQLTEFLNDKKLFAQPKDASTNSPSHPCLHSNQKCLIQEQGKESTSTVEGAVASEPQTLKKSLSQAHSLFNQTSFRNRQNMRRSVCITKSTKSPKVKGDTFSSADQKSFEQFFLLSVMPESFFSASFDNTNETSYLDSFLCKTVDLFDQYPAIENASTQVSKSSFTFEEMSQCCFPFGVKVRLVPRCALDGAKKLGWVGRDADKYQLHTFTNASGDSHYGVSVIIQEELVHPHVVNLRILRQKRRAATKIQKLVKTYLEGRESGGLYQRFFGKKTEPYDFRRLSDPFNDKVRLKVGALRRISDEKNNNAGPLHKSMSVPVEIEIHNNKSKNRLDPHVKTKAKESFKCMLENEKHGEVCIIEKCFVFVGTSQEEQSLMLCALKQLVDMERMLLSQSDEKYKVSTDQHTKPIRKMSIVLASHAKALAKSATRGLSNKLIANKRRAMLQLIYTQLSLSQEQTRVQYPKNELEHVHRKIPRFEHDSLMEKLSKISLPLPLPQMSDEWGIATLLLRAKATGLLLLVNLLLLERSVLVIGTSTAEVTSCTCALLTLLKPYKWASAFMPLIPTQMLDFVSSPVPFIAGAVSDKEIGLKKIEEDSRVISAIADGMSVLNIQSGNIIVTHEDGIEDIVKNSHGVIHQRLSCYQKRLEDLTKHESSALLSFSNFFQQGASPQESVTIQSLKKDICDHYGSLFKSLSAKPEEWKKYGEFDEETKCFEFFPDRVVSPLQSKFQFQEFMVHTQLFVGFMEEKKDSYVNLMPNSNAAVFIANWLSFKWRVYRRMKTLNYLDAFDHIDWSNRRNTGSGFIGWGS